MDQPVYIIYCPMNYITQIIKIIINL